MGSYLSTRDGKLTFSKSVSICNVPNSKFENEPFIEEPLPRKLSLYLKLKNKNLLAAGEHFCSAKEATNWINKKALKIIQLDTNLMDLNNIYELNGFFKRKKINFIPHNWGNLVNSSANLNLLKSLDKKDKIIEFSIYNNPYDDIFINKAFYLKKGKVCFKKYHGLGIELNNKNLKKYL